MALTIARVYRRAPFTLGVVAIAAGMLSVATETQTVTATPTYQPRDQFPRNDSRSQFGPQQGH